MAAPDDKLRPWGVVLGAGVITGALAGFMAGAIDALVAWGAAAQFVPGFGSHLRFLGFIGASHALAGAVGGLAVTLGLLVLSRWTRLGEVLRFGLREHVARRARAPATALSGLALVSVGMPLVALALWGAYRLLIPNLRGRKGIQGLGVIETNIVFAMIAALAAVAIAILLTFVVGRVHELVLGFVARKWPALGRALASPYAPIVAGLVNVAAIGGLVAILQWESVRVLPLRGLLVAIGGGLLAPLAWRPAHGLTVLLTVMLPALRYGFMAVAPVVVLLIVLATGSAPAITKASSAHTGLGGPITRVLRRAFDSDRDGFARYLGGGDCDDDDATIYPNAPEVPEDGIDQNCVGGDATLKRSLDEVAFVPVPPSVPKDFSVLVITIDTLRADHVGAYGYPRATTPNLDRLAREGVVFEHGWAHAPSTRYSIPAILTGRLPLDVHYDTSVWWPGLLPKATTIAEALVPFGLHTGAITNYDYFDRKRHMDQGFAEYDNENAKLHSGSGPEQTRGSSSKEQTDKAMSFVARHAAQRFLLWVHYYDPHYAYESHADVPAFGTDREALYDNEIAYTDKQIGRLLDDLRARGLYDKTIIVVTGDHGEGFGEHGIELHGYHLYAAQTKVPFIVRVPGLAPRRSTTPAGHVDLLPTLTNLAGGAPTSEMEGRSLVDALAGTDRDRVVYQQLSYEGNHEMRAGASRDCHVIYNVSPDTSWEVYRLDRDPHELTDLAASDACAATRHEVARRYDIEQVPAGAAEALLGFRPTVAAPLDADFGDGVRLLSLEAPATVKAGDTATLTWTFEARGIVAPGWKMFVHLKGPASAFINGDHRPARPFEWWRPGQFIRYTTTVPIPRLTTRGTYTVFAGMMTAGSKHAPARAPRAKIVDNAIMAATIEVTP